MAINLMSTVLYIKLDPSAKEPIKSSQIAASFTLHSIENVTIKVDERIMIRTGLSFIIPHNTFGWISTKAHLALRGIDVCCIVIDSDFKDEVKVLMVNNSKADFEVKAGDAIAQIVFNHYFTGKLRASNQIDRKSFIMKDESIVIVRKNFDTRLPEQFSGNKISFNFLTDEAFLIAPHSRKTIKTGLRFIFSPSVYGMICGFPDLSTNGIDCIEGLLESNENEEEIEITLHNKSAHPVYFAERERIAKAIFIKNTCEAKATILNPDQDFPSCSHHLKQ